MNEGYVWSDWMDCYSHVVIMALFLRHLPPFPVPRSSPKRPLATCLVLSFLSLMLDLSSSTFGITSGLWICLTTGYDHIVTVSWQCPSYPPSCPLPCRPPLHLPNTPSLCLQMDFSLICSSNSYPFLKCRFQCLLLPQGCLTHHSEVGFMSQRPHNYLSLFWPPSHLLLCKIFAFTFSFLPEFNLFKGRE